MAKDNWGTIDFEDVASLTEALEEFNNGNNKNSNSKPSVKSTGKEDGNETRKASNLRAVLEDEEDDEEFDGDDETSGDEDEVDLEDETENTDGDGDSEDDGELASNLRKENEEVRRSLADAQRRLAAAEAREEEARKNESTLRKGSLESQRSSLDSEIKNLKKAAVTARTEGDVEAEIEATAKLQETTLRKLAVESSLEDLEEQEKNPPKKTVKEAVEQVQQPEVPREAAKFMERNPWIANSPESIRRLVASTAQILIDGNNDPNSADFYDKLGKKLSVALEGTNYKVAGTPAKPEKKKAKGSPNAGKEQTSEPAKVTKGADGRTKVKITVKDIEAANRLGFTTNDEIKKYVREKIRLEKATGGNTSNWATIDV